MPPPEAPLTLAVMWDAVTVSRPVLQMPPPLVPEVFRLTVESLIRVVPLLAMPPPFPPVMLRVTVLWWRWSVPPGLTRIAPPSPSVCPPVILRWLRVRSPPVPTVTMRNWSTPAARVMVVCLLPLRVMGAVMVGRPLPSSMVAVSR